MYKILIYQIQDNSYADPYGGYDHHARQVATTKIFSSSKPILSGTDVAFLRKPMTDWNNQCFTGVMATEVGGKCGVETVLLLSVNSVTIYSSIYSSQLNLKHNLFFILFLQHRHFAVFHIC